MHTQHIQNTRRSRFIFSDMMRAKWVCVCILQVPFCACVHLQSVSLHSAHRCAYESIHNVNIHYTCVHIRRRMLAAPKGMCGAHGSILLLLLLCTLLRTVMPRARRVVKTYAREMMSSVWDDMWGENYSSEHIICMKCAYTHTTSTEKELCV